jgi:hypothetical protein
MELVLRRRAIYTGLRPYFDDQELLGLIKIWQDDFSQKPKFALSVYVSRCCNTPQLKQDRAKILGAIFMALDAPISELLPDPFEDLKAADTSSILGFENDDKTKVFMTLLQQIFMNFDDQEEKKIRRFLIENLNKIDCDNRRLKHMQQWLLEQSITLAANYKIEDMQKLVHFTYIAMCEAVGPVKADQYLAQAVKETESSAQKHNFKLHDLL